MSVKILVHFAYFILLLLKESGKNYGLDASENA